MDIGSWLRGLGPSGDNPTVIFAEVSPVDGLNDLRDQIDLVAAQISDWRRREPVVWP
jgi:hypothetical protein